MSNLFYHPDAGLCILGHPVVSITPPSWQRPPPSYPYYLWGSCFWSFFTEREFFENGTCDWKRMSPDPHCKDNHYNDVIMTTVASQITSLGVIYSTVYSDADQRKHQCSASLAFVRGIHRDRWISRTKGQLRGKCFHLMMSSCPGTICS